MTHKALAVVTLALVACASDGRLAPAGIDPSFYGHWRNVETRIHLADGTVALQRDFQCVSDVTEGQATSDCTQPNGTRSHIVSKIVSLTPAGYELEIVENALAPQSVGLRSRVEYRIAGNRQFATVYPPQSAAPSARAPVVKLETIYVRE